jgi:hypothetical protein
MSQLVSEHYEYNTSCMIIFSKTAVRIRLDVDIRTIIVLTGGKLANSVSIMQLRQMYGVIFGIILNYFIVYETYFVVGGF